MAGDLDSAIAEYGEWVDGKIHDRIEAYVEEVSRSNRGIKDHENWAKPDKDRIRELADEEVQYWVYGRVRRYFAAMGATASGGITAGRTYYMEKLAPATYDSVIDFDFGAEYEDQMVRVDVVDRMDWYKKTLDDRGKGNG